MNTWLSKNQQNIKEIWKDIVGCEGIYQVSNLGRIKRLGKSKYNSERILTTNTSKSNPYPRVNLHSCGKKPRNRPVHQLVLEAFVGLPPIGCETRHLDGNKNNNSLNNLQYGTHHINIKDSVKHGTHYTHIVSGQDHNNSKLTDGNVRAILQLLKHGKNNGSDKKYTQKQIGQIFGVGNNAISMIKLNKTWKHIDRGDY